jgi:hypothetical protein
MSMYVIQPAVQRPSPGREAIWISALHLDLGDLPGALRRLRESLAIPAVAQTTDPDLRAARRRVRDYLSSLTPEALTSDLCLFG